MSTPPPPGTLTELRRAIRERAKAEAHEWAAMVAYRDNALARLRRDASPMRRQVERTAISLRIARETLMSEAQVVVRLAAADRVIEHAPRTWEAFGRGWVDAPRVQVISQTLEKLERDDSRQRFDVEALAYARSHTVTELRRWAKRFVARVEADLWAERAEAERAKRFVRVDQLDDGMALLQAYLPAHLAAAIENRLTRLAKAHRGDTHDEDGTPITTKRTLEQLRVDLMAHLLTSTPADHVPGTPGLRCDIAVTIDAGVLTGAVTGPTQAADGSWQVPTGWLLDSAWAGEAFWHRLLTDPITRNTLAHDYRGYSPPDLLRSAIQFRDQVCATPGCLVPADRCEIDHRIPWPRGSTHGDNLDSRCKRDHDRKGHGVALELLTEPAPPSGQPLRIEFMHAA